MTRQHPRPNERTQNLVGHLTARQRLEQVQHELEEDTAAGDRLAGLLFVVLLLVCLALAWWG